MTEDLVASKATALAVTGYLHEQTGEPAYEPRAVLRDLVAQGADVSPPAASVKASA